jgi:hypothetical protein
MEQQPTCGQGLAEHAALNAKLADVFAAVAENLELHLKSLDPTDKASRPEFDAYVALSTEYRELESRMRALALRMESCRDLPMANHDMTVLTSRDASQALERLIAEKRNLAGELGMWVERYQQLTKK